MPCFVDQYRNVEDDGGGMFFGVCLGNYTSYCHSLMEYGKVTRWFYEGFNVGITIVFFCDAKDTHILQLIILLTVDFHTLGALVCY